MPSEDVGGGVGRLVAPEVDGSRVVDARVTVGRDPHKSAGDGVGQVDRETDMNVLTTSRSVSWRS